MSLDPNFTYKMVKSHHLLREFFITAVTNDHKCSGLRQDTFISQSRSLDGQHESHRPSTKVLAGFTENLLPFFSAF